MVFEISGVFDCSDYCGEISLSRNRIKVKRRTDMLQLHGRKKGIWIAVLTVLIFAWTFVIFAQSAKTGVESTGDTNRLIEWIESLVDSVWPDVEVAAHPLRKLAHFGEYLILGVLSAALIGVLGGKWTQIGAWCYATAVALCDEFAVQRMTEGRAPQFTDVLIDSAGALTGVLLFVGALYMVIYLRKKASLKRESRF